MEKFSQVDISDIGELGGRARQARPEVQTLTQEGPRPRIPAVDLDRLDQVFGAIRVEPDTDQ